MVRVLDVDPELLEREDRLPPDVGAGVESGQVEVPALVEDLAACPTVRVLVTSRESLAVGGEWVWRVPSLADAAAGEGITTTLESLAAGFSASTEDGREGVAAFREKRKPKFERR